MKLKLKVKRAGPPSWLSTPKMESTTNAKYKLHSMTTKAHLESKANKVSVFMVKMRKLTLKSRGWGKTGNSWRVNCRPSNKIRKARNRKYKKLTEIWRQHHSVPVKLRDHQQGWVRQRHGTITEVARDKRLKRQCPWHALNAPLMPPEPRQGGPVLLD